MLNNKECTRLDMLLIRSSKTSECLTHLYLTEVNTSSRPVELLYTYHNQSGIYNCESCTSMCVGHASQAIVYSALLAIRVHSRHMRPL